MSKPLKYGLILLGVFLLSYGIASFLSRKAKLKDAEFQKQTAILKTQIMDQAKVAQAVAAQVSIASKQLSDALAENETLKKQVSDLQANATDADVALEQQNATPAPADCTPWIEKYNTDVAAKDREISGLESLIKNQEDSLVDCQKEIGLLNQEVALKQSIIDAQGKELTGYQAEIENLNRQIRYALWRGRLQGFGAGIVGGWFVGKFW
jgi:peptidoglycan hydrolase CwlO-like protein